MVISCQPPEWGGGSGGQRQFIILEKKPIIHQQERGGRPNYTQDILLVQAAIWFSWILKWVIYGWSVWGPKVGLGPFMGDSPWPGTDPPPNPCPQTSVFQLCCPTEVPLQSCSGGHPPLIFVGSNTLNTLFKSPWKALF